MSIGGFNALAKMHSDLLLLEAGNVDLDFSSVSWVDAHLASALRVISDNAFSVVEFNDEGLQTAMVDTQATRTEYAYDAEKRLVSKIDRAGGTTSFAYGSDELLDSLAYPDGRVTTFAHDAFRCLSEITEPTSSKVTFGYDDTGCLVNTTDQNGNTIV